MYKIAAIGDRESVIGFLSVGIEIFEADSPKTAEQLVTRLSETGFGVIFITERLFSEMDGLDFYRDKMLPAIIPVTGIGGNTGIGTLRLHSAVERAVGSDILR